MIYPSALPREQRRVLLVLNEADVKHGLRDPHLVDYLDDPEAHVLQLPGALTVDDRLVTRLKLQNKIRPGALLVQSPYDSDVYEFAEAAITEFAVAKFMYLTRLAGLLGAKRVQVTQLNAVRKDSTTKAKVSAKTPIHAASISTEAIVTNDVRERLQLEDRFTGGPPDAAAALTLLERAGLDVDPTLLSLVEMRTTPNPLTRRELTLSLTREAHQNLGVAAKYSGFKLMTIDSQFSTNVKEKLEVIISAKIEF